MIITTTIDKICPGKRHAYFNTITGLKIRKPLTMDIFKTNDKILKNGYTGKFNFEETMKGVIKYNSSIQEDQNVRDILKLKKVHDFTYQKYGPKTKYILIGIILTLIAYTLIKYGN